MKILVADGYLAAGYNFVNIDDCWPEFQRSSDGKLVANRTRFPSGIAALAKYVCLILTINNHWCKKHTRARGEPPPTHSHIGPKLG